MESDNGIRRLVKPGIYTAALKVLMWASWEKHIYLAKNYRMVICDGLLSKPTHSLDVGQ